MIKYKFTLNIGLNLYKIPSLINKKVLGQRFRYLRQFNKHKTTFLTHLWSGTTKP